jgi:predicted histone-like DNA-binding protein
MALSIRLQKNEIKSSVNYGKYFGHVISTGEVTLDDFANEIQSNCSAKKSDVQLVLTELQATIKRHLQDGQIVVLPEIGRLKLSVETVGVADPKKFNKKKHIKRAVCKFIATGKRGGKRNGRLRYDLCEGVEIGRVTH